MYAHRLNPVRQLRKNAIKLVVRITSVARVNVNAVEVSHCQRSLVSIAMERGAAALAV